MTKRRILTTIIITLLFCFFLLTGCGKSQAIDSIDTVDTVGITTTSSTSSFFQSIPVSEDVDKYKQTLIYDTETLVEYVYLWNVSNGHTVSGMLYEPDGSPKLYSGQNFSLILLSTKEINNYTFSILYDSENFVMYCISLNSSRGCTTFEPLYNSDGTLRVYE